MQIIRNTKNRIIKTGAKVIEFMALCKYMFKDIMNRGLYTEVHL